MFASVSSSTAESVTLVSSNIDEICTENVSK